MKSKDKIYTTFYITEDLKAAIKKILDETELPKTLFYKRAYKNFITKDIHTIDRRILIRKRTDPEYIKRDAYDFDYIDKAQHAELKSIAAENDCSMACVIFQALVEWVSITSFMK